MKTKPGLIFAIVLWIISPIVLAEQPQAKIDPPDWYKAGVVAALEDRLSALPDENYFIKGEDIYEWLPSYLSSEARQKMINKLSSNTTVRIAAINALVELKATDKSAEIEPLLKDDNDTVRSYAVNALVRLMAADKITEIMLSKDDSYFIRIAAIDALVELKAADTIDEIALLLKDNNDSIRGVAINALVQLQATDKSAEIVPLLKDNNDDVRRAAITALMQLQAADKIADIVPLLKDNRLDASLKNNQLAK